MPVTDREAGFTLLEMLVTLAIMALAAGIVFPALQLLTGGRAGDDAAALVAQAMVQARSQALREDAAATVTLDRLGNRLVLSPGSASLDLPPGAVVELPTRGLTFYPDGSATGGSVGIAAGARALTVTVDPLTGRITAP